MYIWGKGRAADRVGSGQTFCRQSRVGSGQIFAGSVWSGPRKVTRGQLWVGKMNELVDGWRIRNELWMTYSSRIKVPNGQSSRLMQNQWRGNNVRTTPANCMLHDVKRPKNYRQWIFFLNTIFMSGHTYLENLKGNQVIYSWFDMFELSRVFHVFVHCHQHGLYL